MKPIQKDKRAIKVLDHLTCLIAHSKPINQKQMADALHMSHATLERKIGRLKEERLLSVKKDGAHSFTYKLYQKTGFNSSIPMSKSEVLEQYGVKIEGQKNEESLKMRVCGGPSKAQARRIRRSWMTARRIRRMAEITRVSSDACTVSPSCVSVENCGSVCDSSPSEWAAKRQSRVYINNNNNFNINKNINKNINNNILSSKSNIDHVDAKHLLAKTAVAASEGHSMNYQNQIDMFLEHNPKPKKVKKIDKYNTADFYKLFCELWNKFGYNGSVSWLVKDYANMKRMIKAQGAENMKTVVEYAFDNWSRFRQIWPRISPMPTLGALFAYRDSIIPEALNPQVAPMAPQKSHVNRDNSFVDAYDENGRMRDEFKNREYEGF